MKTLNLPLTVPGLRTALRALENEHAATLADIRKQRRQGRDTIASDLVDYGARVLSVLEHLRSELKVFEGATVETSTDGQSRDT